MVTDRRRVLALLAAGLVSPAMAESPGMSRASAYAFSFPGLNGGAIRLIDHAGKPILIVNTASQCGFTPQYAGLQELWTRYRDRGLTVVGVPSNDFGGQEPGGPEDIARAAHEGFRRHLPARRQGRGEGRNAASVLPLGRTRAPVRGAVVELPQVPDRPRRPDRGELRDQR